MPWEKSKLQGETYHCGGTGPRPRGLDSGWYLLHSPSLPFLNGFFQGLSVTGCGGHRDREGSRHPVPILSTYQVCTLWPGSFSLSFFLSIILCMTEPHFAAEGYISCPAALTWQTHPSLISGVSGHSTCPSLLMELGIGVARSLPLQELTHVNKGLASLILSEN